MTATTVTQPSEEADQGDPEADHLKGEPQVHLAPRVPGHGEEACCAEEDEKEAGPYA